MKNSLIKLLCLVLSLIMVVTSFSACKKKKDDAVTSSDSADVGNDNPDEIIDDEPDEEDGDSDSDDDGSDDWEEWDEPYDYDDEEHDEEEQDEENPVEEPDEEDPVEEPDEEDPEEDETEKEPDEDEPEILEIPIYNSKPVQTDFLGFNAIYHGFTYMKDSYDRNLTEKAAKEEIKRAAKSGINIARSMFEMNHAWDRTTKSWNWESDEMKAFYRWCLELKEYDVSVLVNHWYANAFADWNYGSGNPTVDGASNNTFDENGKEISTTNHVAVHVPGDPEATYNKFMQFMSDAVKALYAHGCTNANYISPTTENGIYWNNDWGDPLGAEGERYNKNIAELNADIYNRLHRQFVKDGIRNSVIIQGPNVSARSTFAGDRGSLVPFRKYFDAAIDEGAIDLYSCHKYFGNDLTLDNYDFWDAYYTEAEENFSLDNFIHDEFNAELMVGNAVKYLDDPYVGLQVALGEMAMLNHGIRGAFRYSLFDQLFVHNTANNGEFEDGIQRTGTAPSLLKSSIMYPSYYSWSLMSNFMGKKGSTIYAGEDSQGSVYANMSVGKDGSVNIAVVSTEIFDTNLSLKFEKSLGGKTFYRHVYKANEIVGTASSDLIPADLKITNVNSTLNDSVLPYSLVIYTTDIVKQ